jgi:hypothetical protein
MREKYGHDSHGTWNQEWLCWQGPEAIYQLSDLSWRWQSCTAPRVMRQKNTVIRLTGTGTKNDCAGEGEHHFTRSDQPQPELPRTRAIDHGNIRVNPHY